MYKLFAHSLCNAFRLQRKANLLPSLKPVSWSGASGFSRFARNATTFSLNGHDTTFIRSVGSCRGLRLILNFELLMHVHFHLVQWDEDTERSANQMLICNQKRCEKTAGSDNIARRRDRIIRRKCGGIICIWSWRCGIFWFQRGQGG